MHTKFRSRQVLKHKSKSRWKKKQIIPCNTGLVSVDASASSLE
jgi:hypothetical protein